MGVIFVSGAYLDEIHNRDVDDADVDKLYVQSYENDLTVLSINLQEFLSSFVC